MFERSYSKLSDSKYEILGTEQIIASILEDKDSEIAKILQENGLTSGVLRKTFTNTFSRR